MLCQALYGGNSLSSFRLWRLLVPPYQLREIVPYDPRGMADTEPAGDHHVLVPALNVVVPACLVEG